MPWSKFPTISVLKLWLTFLKTGLAGNKVWHLEKCICGSGPFKLDGEENLLLIRWSKLELSGRDMSLTQDSLLIPTWTEGISSLCSKEIKICLHERDREVNPQMEVWLSSINGHVDSKVESWVPVPASRTLLLFFPVTDECHIGKVSLAKKWQLSSQPAGPGKELSFSKKIGILPSVEDWNSWSQRHTNATPHSWVSYCIQSSYFWLSLAISLLSRNGFRELGLYGEKSSHVPEGEFWLL